MTWSPSPREQGLQKSLDLLEQYCQTWALAVNLNKTKIMTFQKDPDLREQNTNSC
uniref:Reverse transcriptase domain-containing protein n=1 Tax=Anguilla anguilla TaxID=7936 RepID=A0A0E9VPK4_ANGAN